MYYPFVMGFVRFLILAILNSLLVTEAGAAGHTGIGVARIL